jgi:PASTA domain
VKKVPSPPELPPRSKTVWSQWWFWVAVVVVLRMAIGVSSGDAENTAADSPSASVTAEMPDIVGLSVPDALQALEPFGIHLILPTEQLSRKPEGTVLSEDPPAGSEIDPEATLVTVVVAKPFPRVPSVVGDKLVQARRELKRADFSVSVEQEESNKPTGTVISQSPAGGKAARPGRVVKLVVASPILGAYGNPWGYKFGDGSFIYNPPYTFCNYFPCISSFWDGSGYVIQCTDSDFSKSGGIQGSCSYHGGNWRPLYQ